MKLFELNRLTYEVEISSETLLLEPFRKLVDRDKSKTKETAKKELSLIYFYCDIRSDYFGLDNSVKLSQIIDNLGFPKKYVPDKLVKEAMEFYSSFKTPVEILYEGAVIAGQAISDHLRNTKDLLEERTEKGGVVTSITSVTSSLKNITTIMREIKAAYKEVALEKKETEGRIKGSKKLGMFEGTNTFRIE